jgi:outer membrane receptor protein involved in Fe transport
LFDLPDDSTTRANFNRFVAYEYHHWKMTDDLLWIGGLTFDDITYPANFRRPPLSSNEASRRRWSPKMALIWTPSSKVTLRGAAGRATGGVSYDESVRLEPTQLAGFGQAFRSLISESLVGSVEAPDYYFAGGAVDWHPWPNTWITLQGEALEEKVDQQYGLFAFNALASPAVSDIQTMDQLDYQEIDLQAVLNQIIAREWFLELNYQYSHSTLDQYLPDIPASAGYARTTSLDGGLHKAGMAATWRPVNGWFARAELNVYAQTLSGSSPQPPGDAFSQMNLYAGYRFPRRSGELIVGLLDLYGQDYQLSPINYYLDLPRSRTFYARFRFNM